MDDGGLYAPHISEAANPNQTVFVEDENGNLVEKSIGDLMQEEDDDEHL